MHPCWSNVLRLVSKVLFLNPPSIAMSGRLYNPQDYPLPYLNNEIDQWPIYRLSEDKDMFTAEVKDRTIGKLRQRFKTKQELHNELAKVLYQERIRLTEKP